MTPEDLRAGLGVRADEAGLRWLDDACAGVGGDPGAFAAAFPAASRQVGRHPLEEGADPSDPFAWTVDDAARALLAAALPADALASALQDAYRHGDARERRGALRALDVLDADPAAARALVDDALRTNDTRIVAAALGPAGVALLDDAALAQAVLKCLFVGLDTTRIPGLAGRTTPEMARMAADLVHERIAAGRTVPADVWRIIDAHPPADRLAAIEAEVDHPTPERAAAARAALALRPPPPPP